MQFIQASDQQPEQYATKKRWFRDLFRRRDGNSSQNEFGRKLAPQWSKTSADSQKQARDASTYDARGADIDAIMGNPKANSSSERPNSSFLLQQRIQASSGATGRSSPFIDGLSASRLTKPLTEDEQRALFRGAPFFSNAFEDGVRVPKVTFPGVDDAISSHYESDRRPSDINAHLQASHNGAGHSYVQSSPSTSAESGLPSAPALLYPRLRSDIDGIGVDCGTIGFHRFLAALKFQRDFQSPSKGSLESARKHDLPASDSLDNSSNLLSLEGQKDGQDATNDPPTGVPYSTAISDGSDSPEQAQKNTRRDRESPMSGVRAQMVEQFADEIGYGEQGHFLGVPDFSMPRSTGRSSHRSVPSFGSAMAAFNVPDMASGTTTLPGASIPLPAQPLRPVSLATNSDEISLSDAASRVEDGTSLSRSLSAPPTAAVFSSPLKVVVEAAQVLDKADANCLSAGSRSWLEGHTSPEAEATEGIMTTLLETANMRGAANSQEAVSHGGVIAGSRTFWRRDTIIGRVLAGTDGAKESMGWISAVKRFQMDEGVTQHLITESLPVATAEDLSDETEDLVSIRSAPAAANKSVTRSQFVLALDGPPVMGNEVCFERLSVVTDSETDDTDDKESKVFQLTFSSPINHRLGKLEVSLVHDVSFVSSYPCHPVAATASNETDRTSNTTTPYLDTSTIERTDSRLTTRSPVSFEEIQAAEEALPQIPAHLLHSSHRYNTIPIATLLSLQPHAESVKNTPNKFSVPHVAEEKELVVLDCRGSEDLEVLGRAWCAKVGEHALIGKSGRTCLACCIREARALGICAVIRI